jgi:hypothetical protein
MCASIRHRLVEILLISDSFGGTKKALAERVRQGLRSFMLAFV